MTDPETLAERVREGELGLHELEDHADHDEAAAARRRLLEAETGADVETVGDYSFPAEDADSNVENAIGAAQVPMGVAGPAVVNVEDASTGPENALVDGEDAPFDAEGTGPISGTVASAATDGGAASGEYYLPMATTEGALVASVNRGLSVIREAGGATARVTKSGMTRAPVFGVDGVAEAAETVAWVEDHVGTLREAAESTTGHGELLGVEPYVVGDSVYLRCSYDTKDAMGMNMATIATREACDVVESETPASLVALSGNLCSDKKPAAINAVEGRGRSVTADVVIPGEVVADRLHTTPRAVAKANTRKNLIGSAKAASLGFNAQAANVVAAVFLATGQDEAQVVEGANAITTVNVREREATASPRADERSRREGEVTEPPRADEERRDDERSHEDEGDDGHEDEGDDGHEDEGDDGVHDLYASVSLASLEVGTVGGGTNLPTQSEALEVLGLRGSGNPPGANADALAEVIAVGVLGGELSLLAALASSNLASAHEELGR